MKTRTLKQLLLYNYRYLFGYGTICVFVAYFLGWQLGEIGPGLSQSEIITAAQHTDLKELANLPINPLHSLLQWVSIEFLGVSGLALRLPSVLIALVTAICLYKLLKKLFGRQTALLSTAILISADWFLFTARLGTGSIEFSLWFVAALFCLTKLIENKTKWLLGFTLSLMMLLFVPFGPYVAFALTLSVCICRLFRERIKETAIFIKITSILLGLVGLAAATAISLNNLAFLKGVLGVNNLPTVGGFLQNIFFNAASMVAVLPNASPVISPSGILFIRFFELIFILFGVIMLWRTRVNRLNLTILILSTVLVIASGLNSGARSGSLLIIPAAIYMTAGIRHLMHRWKRIFPKNPYARVAAYIPLGILFIGVVGLHYVSYFQLWPNQTATHTVFSRDLQLVAAELDRPEHLGKSCFVESNDSNLNQLIAASRPRCNVTYTLNTTPADTLILQPGSPLLGSTAKARALVSETIENNVRWLVVKNQPIN